MPLHPLTNFEIKEYYENESRFKTTKNGAYMVNLQDYLSPGTHWVSPHIDNEVNEVIYCDSFGVEHVPKEIKKYIGHKNIKTNIFRIQADNSIMCGYFCIGLIDFMFAGRSLIDFTSFFSPYDFNKNDGIILSYFK